MRGLQNTMKYNVNNIYKMRGYLYTRGKWVNTKREERESRGRRGRGKWEKREGEKEREGGKRRKSGRIGSLKK